MRRITFETRSVRDASTVATPASRDATASAAQIAIGQTLVPSHMSKERFGTTSHFAAALAKSGGLTEMAKPGEQPTSALSAISSCRACVLLYHAWASDLLSQCPCQEVKQPRSLQESDTVKGAP